MSPGSELWSYEEYLYQGGERLMKDLFDDGYVDHAIFQPAQLGEFYYKGFGQTDEAFAARLRAPGQADLQPLLRPAQRRGRTRPAPRGRQEVRPQGRQALHRRMARRVPRLAARRPVGIPLLRGLPRTRHPNIHVHKGPTIRPLDRDAFDVADVDHVATDFTDLNFVVEHCGLPRLEDFCWIATQEPNVHGGLAVAMPFIHTRPKYFAQIMGELLYWIGEDRIQFSSDYAIWTPRWLVEAFVDFQIPDDLGEYAPITTEQKKKILGLNAAKMYDIPVPAELQLPEPTSPRSGRAAPTTWSGPEMGRYEPAYDALGAGGRSGARRADHRPRLRALA